MKLKAWLKEYENLSYLEFKALPEEKQSSLRWHHNDFCRKEQIRKLMNWRPATEGEIEYHNNAIEKEMKRHEINEKINGLDERGNYTALHYRFFNGKETEKYMYEELKNKILSRFENTEDDIEYIEYPSNIHIIKKVAGFFNYDFVYTKSINTEYNKRVAFVDEDEGSYVTLESGRNHTAKIIGCAYEASTEYLISDIMIASAFCELLNFEANSKHFKACDNITLSNIEQIKEIVEKSICILKENRYGFPYEILPKRSSYIYKQRFIIDGCQAISIIEKWISGKILNADDYCEYIYDRFEWYNKKKNHVIITTESTIQYEFAKLEKDMNEFIESLGNILTNPNTKENISLIKETREKFKKRANKFDIEDVSPKRAENIRSKLKELEKVISVLEKQIEE